MGLINFIREKLPEPLLKASTDLRMKNELILRIYAAVPQAYKNKYHFREGISRVKMIFYHWDRGTAIYHLIDMTNATNEEKFKKWQDLDIIARNIQELCK